MRVEFRCCALNCDACCASDILASRKAVAKSGRREEAILDFASFFESCVFFRFRVRECHSNGIWTPRLRCDDFWTLIFDLVFATDFFELSPSIARLKLRYKYRERLSRLFLNSCSSRTTLEVCNRKIVPKIH